LVICVENNQTFLDLFCSEWKLIQDRSIKETAEACRTREVPDIKNILNIMWFLSYSNLSFIFMKSKSEKLLMPFHSQNFVIPKFFNFYLFKQMSIKVSALSYFELKEMINFSHQYSIVGKFIFYFRD
jgi:hypothetical protein